ncbi:MAG: regulatory protein GemA [Sphingobium sp.]|uniref:regulatory protein GemA n=1 Tax=Sphingobium sp. TaxID=1912891 RepID=UPI002E214AC2
MNALAKPATFAADPRRRKLIAVAKIATKQLGMDDDDYRAVLMRATGRMSAKDCTTAELERLAAEFRRIGFSAQAKPRKPGATARADHPMARKARVLWICLAHLCAIDIDPQAAIRDDKALEHFSTRQLKCQRLQWAKQSEADKLIEALKAMAERHGWDQSVKGLSKATYVHALKVRLCDAILAKLKRAGIAADSWNLEEAAFRLCGIEAADHHRPDPRVRALRVQRNQLGSRAGRYHRPLRSGQGDRRDRHRAGKRGHLQHARCGVAVGPGQDHAFGRRGKYLRLRQYGRHDNNRLPAACDRGGFADPRHWRGDLRRLLGDDDGELHRAILNGCPADQAGGKGRANAPQPQGMSLHLSADQAQSIPATGHPGGWAFEVQSVKEEFRCPGCRALLFKAASAAIAADIEIKCRRCRRYTIMRPLSPQTTAIGAAPGE